MARPVDNTFPRWATDGTNNTEPTEPEKDTGWPPGDPPPAQYENWRSNTVYNWVQYYDSTINGFAAKENDPPDLSIVIGPGILRYGQSSILPVNEQTSTAFVAPSVNPKIIGVLVHRETGALLNAEGAEDPSPLPPPIPDGYLTTCWVELSPSQTEILNEDINELRANVETLSPEVEKAILDSQQTPDPEEVGQLSDAIGNISASPTMEITSNYNVLLIDSGRLLLCDSSGGSFGVSLQSAALSGDRFSLIVKKTSNDFNTVNIAVPGSNRIDGNQSITLRNKNQAIEIRCDGVNDFYISNTFNSEYKNILVGGNISTNLFQSGLSTDSTTTPPNDNNVYVADQWILQSDGNDTVNVSRTGESLLSSTVVTANRKWGFLIPIEGSIYRRLSGHSCSIACEIQNTSGTISNVRMALLSSGAGATTDVVSSWNASGVDPTLNSPWTYQNTPADHPVSTSEPGLIVVENIQVAANPPNIGAVFIWVDDDDASVSDEIAIRRAALVKSPVFTFFSEEGVEGILAQYRYYQKSYNAGVTPGTVTDAGQYTYCHPTNTTSLDGLVMRSTVDMRTSPVVTVYSPVTGDSGVVAGDDDSNKSVDSIDSTGTKSSGKVILVAPGSANDVFKAHFTLNARI